MRLMLLSTVVLLGACKAGESADVDVGITVHGKSLLQTFPITKYGAVPDGVTLCTVAIKAAVEAARAAAGAAGTAHVVIPAANNGGTFLTGAFSLASGVYLKVEQGGVLRASVVASDYPASGWNWDPALIDTYNCTRTGIIGGGIIDGQALPHWVEQ